MLFFVCLSVGLLVVDSRQQWLQTVRQGMATVLFPIQRVLLVPRGSIETVNDYVSEVTRLRRENDELRRVEISNSKLILQSEALTNENNQLRRLLGARDRAAVRSIIGEVLYEARDPFSKKLVLDKGTQQGVAIGQPVIDSTGVVGQITRVFPLSSEMTALTDRGMTVPVQNTRTQQRAVAYGLAGAGLLELRYLPLNADVRDGDHLVTSGLDGLYPAGLPVGKVSKVNRDVGGFSKADVVPAGGVDRANLLLVLLVEANLPAPPPEPTTEPRGKRKKSS
jgi:rod shape-determining protein MreC